MKYKTVVDYCRYTSIHPAVYEANLINYGFIFTDNAFERRGSCEDGQGLGDIQIQITNNLC